MEKEIDAEVQTNGNELIDVNRDLLKIETNILPMKKKRMNETSVSIWRRDWLKFNIKF